MPGTRRRSGWSVLPRGTARRCCSRIRQAAALALTWPGSGWTTTTTTRNGCGRRWSPPSPPARRCRGQPAARAVAPGGLAGAPEFLAEFGSPGAAAPADQVDPRRRARTGRPRCPARPPDLHAEPAGRDAARPVQPPGPAAVAAAAASGGPAVGIARRADAVLAGRGGHPAGPDGPSAHRRAGRGCGVPAGGRRACDWPRWRWPRPPTGTASSPSSPTISVRWPTTWSRKSFPGCRRTSGSSCGRSASATHCRAAWQRSCPVAGRRKRARRARVADLAGLGHRAAAGRLPHPGTAADLPARRPAPAGPAAGARAARHRRPLVGRRGPAHPRPGPRRPQRQHRVAVGPAAPLRRAADPQRGAPAAAPGAVQPGRPGHRIRPVAGPDLRADPPRGR